MELYIGLQIEAVIVFRHVYLINHNERGNIEGYFISKCIKETNLFKRRSTDESKVCVTTVKLLLHFTIKLNDYT